MLTLEERERIAYITNSPEHPLIVEAIDSENDALDEMRHERDMAQGDVKDGEAQVEKLETELEQAEDKVEKLEAEVNELRDQIHEAGVDLV
jgi:peptidoglycan hydrolase CwlO-like protein